MEATILAMFAWLLWWTDAPWWMWLVGAGCWATDELVLTKRQGAARQLWRLLSDQLDRIEARIK
jgi:hypothetical protein